MSHKPVAVFAVVGTPEAEDSELHHGSSDCAEAWLSPTDWRTSPARERIARPCEESVESLRRVGLEQRFLAQIGEAFGASLDHRETLQTVAHMAAGSIADLCLIGMAGENGTLELLAVEDAEAVEPRSSASLIESSVADAPAPSILEALRADEVRIVARLEAAGDDPLYDTLRRLGMRSLIIAPMVARGQRLGVIVLGSRHASVRYGRRAADLAGELARRAALAVDNARLYEEARRAVRARDEMLAVVAHDLRNPLGVISMTAELIRDLDTSQASPATQRLDMIRRSADQMERLIHDLLDVSRIEAGRFLLDRNVEDPGQIVREAAESLRPLAERARQTLVYSAEPGLPPVAMDRGRVLQAIGNLVGNAVKFTPAGGTITIHAEQDAEGVRFSVRDTGQGIPARQLPHLFDRFWQARATDRRGLGLGLAIVKGVAEAHGGTVEAESTLGQGTSISFTVPREA